MKRISTPKLLGHSWINDEIAELSIASRNGVYVLTADRETIWNGNRIVPIFRRHRALNLILRLRPGTLSVGAAVRNCADSAIKSHSILEPNAPRIVLLDSLKSESISICKLETLQEIALSSSEKILESLARSFRLTDSKSERFTVLKSAWDLEVRSLEAIGLTIPKAIEGKKWSSIAKRRLLDE